MGNPKPKPVAQGKVKSVAITEKDKSLGSIEVLEAVEAINEMDRESSSGPAPILTPKPKPRDREKVHVTNPGFRDSEPLRELQRQLHRSKNRK